MVGCGSDFNNLDFTSFDVPDRKCSFVFCATREEMPKFRFNRFSIFIAEKLLIVTVFHLRKLKICDIQESDKIPENEENWNVCTCSNVQRHTTNHLQVKHKNVRQTKLVIVIDDQFDHFVDGVSSDNNCHNCQ